MHQSPPAAASSTPRPCACTTVRRASRVLARVFDAALERSGMNVTQLAVLRAIERHMGEPLTRVAEDLCMERTSLYRAAATMQKEGWIAMADGPDARARTATVTAAGRKALKAADPHWAKTQADIIERFGGKAAWAALVASLGKLAASADEVSASNHKGKKLR